MCWAATSLWCGWKAFLTANWFGKDIRCYHNISRGRLCELDFPGSDTCACKGPYQVNCAYSSWYKDKFSSVWEKKTSSSYTQHNFHWFTPPAVRSAVFFSMTHRHHFLLVATGTYSGQPQSSKCWPLPNRTNDTNAPWRQLSFTLPHRILHAGLEARGDKSVVTNPLNTWQIPLNILTLYLFRSNWNVCRFLGHRKSAINMPKGSIMGR